jgi:tetratricopeptide (TPR) repeat protein
VDNSIRNYELEIDKDDSNCLVFYRLGIAYYRATKFNKAINVLSNIMEKGCQLDMAYYWMGLAYISKDKKQAALVALVNAIKKDINSARINFLAAELAQELKDWNLAENLWGSLSTTFPKYEYAQEMLDLIRQRKINPVQSEAVAKPLSPDPVESSSPENILNDILNAPDIAKAVENYQNQLTPGLVDLVLSNAKQAERDEQPVLASGLMSLAGLMEKTISPSRQ